MATNFSDSVSNLAIFSWIIIICNVAGSHPIIPIRWNANAVSSWNVWGMLYVPGTSLETRRKYWRQWNDETFKKVIGDIGSKENLIICAFQEVWGTVYTTKQYGSMIGHRFDAHSSLKLPFYTNFDANAHSIFARLTGKGLGLKLNSGLLTMSNWKHDTLQFYKYDECKFPDCMAAKGVIFTLYSSVQSDVYVKTLVFNTHLDANAPTALKQVKELHRFIHKMRNKYCLLKDYCEVILMGDFNIDWRSKSKVTRDFKHTMEIKFKMSKISNPENVGTYLGDNYPEYDLIFVRRFKPMKKSHEDVTARYQYIGTDVQVPMPRRMKSVQDRMEKDGVEKDTIDFLSDHNWIASKLGSKLTTTY